MCLKNKIHMIKEMTATGKGFVLACCILLVSCEKERIYFDDGPDDEITPTVSGTTWTPVMPLFFDNARVMGMGVVDDYLLLTFLQSTNTSGRFDGEGLILNSQNLGSGFGFEKIEFINGQPYGLGLLGSSAAFSYDVTEDYYPWDPVADIGTNGYALAEYNGQKVIGCGVAPYVRIENSGTYTQMGGAMNGPVYDLVVYNGWLYAAGSFTQAGTSTTEHIARWNGSYWTSLDSGLDGVVRDLIVYQDKLIALGNFYTSGGSIECEKVAVWDGNKWATLKGGLTGGNNGTFRATVYNNDLIIGGDFDYGGGSVYSPNIIKWNGADWEALAGGAPDIIGEVCVYKDKLYIANQFFTSGENFLLRLD